MLNAGRVLSREQLEQHLYSWGREVESNAVEVHIHHLRRKLGAGLIQTVRGVGYLLPRDKGGTGDAPAPSLQGRLLVLVLGAVTAVWMAAARVHLADVQP
jgi:hypothetical protein